jgi:pimeloyl-ACP methyl ester carboxylesterase
MMPMSLRLVFNPAKVTDAFRTQFPTDMSIRPSQLRAISADALHMIPDADRTWSHLPEEPVPALIIAGASDRIVDHEGQSAKLADALPGSTYMLVEGAGHMVHHSHADAVAMAIDLFLVRSQAPSPAADQSRPI